MLNDKEETRKLKEKKAFKQKSENETQRLQEANVNNSCGKAETATHVIKPTAPSPLAVG